MAAVISTIETVGPLDQTQHREVAAAHDRAQKIRKAAAVAKFNGWTTGICAVCSAPFALFSLSGFLVAVGLSVIAYNEFKGCRRLLKYDLNASSFLGWNQVGFLAIITCYCVWMLVVGFSSQSQLVAELQAQPELAGLLDSPEGFDQLYKTMLAAFYGLVIALSVVFQGLNAIYYFTRKKYVQAYVQETPSWVIELQQLTASK